MEASSLRCSRCEEPLPPASYNAPGMTACAGCASPVRLVVFPAALKPVETGKTGELIIVEGEASCYYHPEKKAVLTCGYCGRFLCSLCDVELNGDHLCPPCIESGKKKGKLKNLENHRVRYDDVALALAIIPMLFSCFVALTAPITLYVAIHYWNAPGSILPRTRIRFVIAILFAVVQLTACAVFAYFLFVKGIK